MIRVQLHHARALHYCNKGMRAFCERHGLDFNKFRKEGLPVDELAHIDDAMLNALIERAQHDGE